MNHHSYQNIDVILIDEFQFYENNYKEVIQMVEKDCKIVIIASLDGDYLKKPIGDVLKLIPYCDNLIRLSALCRRCKDGTKAHFTKRILNNNNKIFVGDKNEYEAVCRFHFNI
jgi:thymidine kinase